MSMDFLFSRI